MQDDCFRLPRGNYGLGITGCRFVGLEPVTMKDMFRVPLHRGGHLAGAVNSVR